MSYDFKGRLSAGLSQLEIALDDDSVDRLEKYFYELKKWGKIGRYNQNGQ